MKRWRQNWDEDQLAEMGATKVIEFKFISADSQHQNGICESMVRQVKRAMKSAIGDTAMTLQEAVTFMLEACELVNQRPIGVKPNADMHPEYISPNHILLGRATDRICSGPFEDWRLFEEDDVNFSSRFLMVQHTVSTFWKIWRKLYFPSLLIRKKWHTGKRNLREQDVVMYNEDSIFRGKWRLALVEEVFPDDQGRVRNVKLDIKDPVDGDPDSYRRQKHHYVTRHASKLVVLLPVEEQRKG